MAETRVIITAEAQQAIQEFNRLRAEASGSLQQIASAGAQLNRTGVSAGQTAAALRQVPAQFTDIVTSLQAGQAPLTVLLQQGGQLRDSFGSSGAAARALAGYVGGLVNPLTVAAAAVVVTGVAYNQAREEANAFQKALVLSGNTAGTTVGQLNGMAAAISRTSGTQAEAASALTALVGTGKIGAESMERFGLVAVQSQKLLGIAVGDTAKAFADLGTAPLETSKKLDEQYNYLTLDAQRQIKALQEQGQYEQAASLAQSTFADAMETRNARIKSSMGTLESAWTASVDGMKGAWDSFVGIFRADTLPEQIAKAEEKLKKAKAARFTFLGGGADGAADEARVARELQNLKDTEERTKRIGAAQAENDRAKEANLKWDEDGVKYLTREEQLQRDLTKARNMGVATATTGTDAAETERKIAERQAAIRKSYSDIYNAGIDGQIEAIKRRGAVEDIVTKRSMDLLSGAKAAGIVTEQAYIEQVGALDMAEFTRQKGRLQEELALTAGKQNSQKDQAALRGQIAEVEARETSRQIQLTTDLYVLQAKTEREVMDKILASTAARNSMNDALGVEYATYGQVAEARDQAMVPLKSEAELQKYLMDAQRAGKPISDEMIAQLRAEKDMRDSVEVATMAQTKALGYAQQLHDENKKFAADSLTDPRARADAMMQIDADIWTQRIRLAGEGTEAQKLLQAEYNTWYANQSKKLLADVDVTRATELLRIMESVNEATKSAAAGMEASFGDVGKAIGGLTTAMSEYGRIQAAIAAQLALATKDSHGDQSKIMKANAMAAEQSAQAQVKSYGDMAGAAKGFFKENSAGYKVMEATEKAFRAYEMVMAIESMAKKIFFKESEVAANTALNATKLSGEAATTAASTTLAGAEASAWGITAVVKALASLPFPANLAAGAATLAAVVAIGAKLVGSFGGGSSNVAKDRQAAAGTGTVFGDAGAKSDSIVRAVELTASNSGIELSHTAGMLASLRNIESSISGLGNLVVRGSGLTGTVANAAKGSAENFVNSTLGTAVLGGSIGLAINKLTGGLASGIVGKVAGAIFGGATSVDDTGLALSGGTLGSISTNGVRASQYTDITKKGGWFSSDKHSSKSSDLGSEANDQFTKVIMGLSDSVKAAAGLLTIGGDAFTDHLNQFVVDVGKISLKGLKGDEIQKELETVFSKLGDDMAKFAVGGLDQFQKVGEGYFETLSRIASDYANLDSILAASGTTFGATGMASIAARERLIDLTGGIDKLASSSQSFNENFLSQAEQLAPVQKYVNDQLAAMGRAGITTRDQFKDAVLGLANSGALATEAGAKDYAQLLALSDAFAKTHAATVDLTKSEQQIADERKGLQDQLDQLTMTSAQLADKARAAIDGHNLALYDQVQAAQAAKAAADERKGLQDQLDQLTMTSVQLLARQRDALDASNTALFDQIQAETAAKAARDAADAAAKAARDAATADLGTITGSRNGIADEIFNAALGGKDLQGKIAMLKAAEDSLWAMVGPDAASIATLDKIKALDSQRLGFESQLQDKTIADLKTQYDTRKALLTTELESMQKMRDFAGQMHDFATSLQTGSLSALDPKGQLDVAQAAYQDMLAKARGGDAAAMSGLQGAAQNYLQLDKSYNGSNGAYASTFGGVIAALEQFATVAPTDAQLDAQKQQISIIESTSSSLGTTIRDTSGQQIEVLKRIDAALAAAQSATEAQLRQAGATNAELIKQVSTLNRRLADIESKLALAAMAP